MAQASKIKPPSSYKFPVKLPDVLPYVVRAVHEAGFIVCAGAALYLFAALWSFRPEDPAWTHTAADVPIANWGGSLGARLADILLYFLGYVAYLLPLSVVFWGWRFFRRKGYLELDAEIVLFRFLGLLVVLGAAAGLAALHFGVGQVFASGSAGGIVGALTGPWLITAFGGLGGNLFLLILLMAGFTLATGYSWLELVDGIGAAVTRLWSGGQEGVTRVRAWVKTPPDGDAATQDYPAGADEPPAGDVAALDTMTAPLSLSKRAHRIEPIVGQTSPESLNALPPLSSRGAIAPNSLGPRMMAPSVQTRLVAPQPAVVESLLPPLNLLDPAPSDQAGRMVQMLASSAFAETPAPAALALGVDVGAAPVVVNLAKLPHLLIGGDERANLAGLLHAFLLSLVYKSRPRALRLALMDSAAARLALYEGIPHLLAPVARNVREAVDILAWCDAELEDRKRLLASLNVRDIAGFNLKVGDARKAGQPLPNPFRERAEAGDETSKIPALETLPLVVVVIAELAELIDIVGDQSDSMLYNLARQGRMAGLHLIVATQQPVGEVITGLLKATIPARLALKVDTPEASRLILDQTGAERLPGAADMLYLPPGTDFPRRIRAPGVTEAEIKRVADYLRQTGVSEYLNAM